MDVRLEAFEGPLDLLMRLIEKNEIDIYDIPIAQLTDQYLETIAAFPNDMEGISEFILMAATLLEIKSRMLLPRPPAAGEADEDPRETLVKKLLEYKRCQTLAEQLKSFPLPGARFTRDGEQALYARLTAYTPAQVMEGVPLETLHHIFSDVIRRCDLRIDRIRADYGDMPRERFTIEEKITYIRRHLKTCGAFRLSALLENCTTREEMVVTFLALLEMIRLGQLRVRQPDTFAEVLCEGMEI